MQAATLPIILSGADTCALAKTGTGKTLAFLIPSIQRLLSLPTPPPSSRVSILVLSPTRELALQIEVAAKMLLAGHDGYGVCSVIGGSSNVDKDSRKIMGPQR